MSDKIQWLGQDDQGERGSPGTGYTKMWAGVRLVRPGLFECKVVAAHGANQGYLEEHDREERRFRADSLDDLLRITLHGLARDADFESPKFAQAVRNAIFEAQDAEAED